MSRWGALKRMCAASHFPEICSVLKLLHLWLDGFFFHFYFLCRGDLESAVGRHGVTGSSLSFTFLSGCRLSTQLNAHHTYCLYWSSCLQWRRGLPDNEVESCLCCRYCNLRSTRLAADGLPICWGLIDIDAHQTLPQLLLGNALSHPETVWLGSPSPLSCIESCSDCTLAWSPPLVLAETA